MMTKRSIERRRWLEKSWMIVDEWINQDRSDLINEQSWAEMIHTECLFRSNE